MLSDVDNSPLQTLVLQDINEKKTQINQIIKQLNLDENQSYEDIFTDAHNKIEEIKKQYENEDIKTEINEILDTNLTLVTVNTSIKFKDKQYKLPINEYDYNKLINSLIHKDSLKDTNIYEKMINIYFVAFEI